VDTKTTSIEPIFVSKKDAAEALAVCIRTVDYLAAAKRIVTRKVGRRTLVLYSSLQSFARCDTPTVKKLRRQPPRMENRSSVGGADAQ
jgi:hypothetical protein